MRQSLALLLVLAASGCGELPDPQISAPGAPTSTNGGGEEPVVDTTPPDSPVLGQTPQRWGYTTLPLRGDAEPYATIFVEGGASPVATDADASGSFCLDVPLTDGARQTLSVYAQDAAGLTSEPATFTVVMDPTAAATNAPAAPTTLNLASSLSLVSDETPKDGQLAALTDGDEATSVLVMASTVWLDFGEPLAIESVELVFPDAVGAGDDTFATEYAVLASSASAPVMPPSATAGGWSELFHVYPDSGLPAGDGGIDTLALAAPVQARYVAIQLVENNKVDWFSTENIRVAEVRVFGRLPQGTTPPAPATPTCASGD